MREKHQDNNSLQSAAGSDDLRQKVHTGLILTCLAAWIAFDLWWDLQSSAGIRHLIAEALLSVLVALGIFQLMKLLVRARSRSGQLQNELVRAERQAQSWKEENRQILQGLGNVIDQQFARWKLSASEREVGLLLLKGLSIKEIAGMRETSERTARHQALSLYQKAGIAGRAELSAFFLEDLMLPMQQERSLPAEAQRPDQKKQS